MDVRILLDQPTLDERAAVDRLLGPPASGWEGGEFTGLDGHVAYGGHEARAQRHLLLPALHAVQDSAGSVSKGALTYICDRLTIPPAEAYGVATFYALIDTTPRRSRGSPGSHIRFNAMRARRSFMASSRTRASANQVAAPVAAPVRQQRRRRVGGL